MTRRIQLVFASALLFVLGSPATGALAQRAQPVAHLDLRQFTGTWYQIARLPDAAEKKCLSDGMVLYALNDKPGSFQAGLFCTVKGGDAKNTNTAGKQNKTGTGELKASRFFFFSTKYEVLTTDPGYNWALVGTPNHKTLWLLARTPSLDPAVRAQLEQTATAGGYPVAKLVPVTHTVATYRAEQGAPTGQKGSQPVAQPAPPAR